MKSVSAARLVMRVTMILAGLYLVTLGVATYYVIGTYDYLGSYQGIPIRYWHPAPSAIVISLLSIFFGLASFALSVKPSRRRMVSVFILAITVTIAAGAVSAAYFDDKDIIIVRTPLTTDAYMLQVEASKDILRGVNPYTQNYSEILLDRLPPDPLTWVYSSPDPPFTADKIVGFVNNFDYLPPAALYYIPAHLFRIPPHIWDAIVASIGLSVLYWALPSRRRYLYPALVGGGIFLYLLPLMGRTGVTGWFVPLLLAVLFPEMPVLSGFLLAFASLYRVYVGVFALFLLVAYHREGFKALRILVWAALFGILMVAPFAIRNPWAVIEAFTTPYRLNLNPLDMGPGISSLGFLGLLAPKEVYSVAMFATIVVGLIVSYKWYHKVKYAAFVFPTIAMLFYYRPSYVYYYYYPLLGAISYATGKIQFLDEDFDRKAEKFVASLGLLVLAASLAGSFTFIEVLPERVPQVALAISVGIAFAPLILYYSLKHISPPRPRNVFIAVLVSIVLASIIVGPLSPVYYISFNRTGMVNAVLDVAEKPGAPIEGVSCYRLMVPSRPDLSVNSELSSFNCSNHHGGESFSPLVALVVKASLSHGLPLEILVYIVLAFTTVVLALGFYAKTGVLGATVFTVLILSAGTLYVLDFKFALTGFALTLLLVSLYVLGVLARIPALSAAAISLAPVSSYAGPLLFAALLGDTIRSGGRRRSIVALAIAITVTAVSTLYFGPRRLIASLLGVEVYEALSSGCCLANLLGYSWLTAVVLVVLFSVIAGIISWKVNLWTALGASAFASLLVPHCLPILASVFIIGGVLAALSAGSRELVLGEDVA
ncbi:MAG: hypothetical protein F7C35_01725 [Desulfurococcales archaeon]|nr:hypothetical protein [Desulfurococcales archaeon]